MDGQLKTTQPKWEGLTNTNIKMDNLVKFFENVISDQNKYFPPSGLSEYKLSDNYTIYATSNLGNKLNDLITEIKTLELFYFYENGSNSSYNNYSDFKNIFYDDNNILNKDTIIGQLLVEEYGRINPILKRLESIQTSIDEIKINFKYYNQTIFDANKNTMK